MPCPENRIISGCDFAQYLVHQAPVYDKLIVEDIRPTDPWVLHVKTGTWEAYTDTTHTIDRFTHVEPDLSKRWTRVQTGGIAGACDSTPCDKNWYCIGWGADRRTYYLQEQNWRTPLICFDQAMHITHAREHFRQIIQKILRPATTAIQAQFIRKGLLANIDAGNLWTASAAMTPFTFQWSLGPLGDEEIFFDCSVPPTFPNVSKLTPQMLQRRMPRLLGEGYLGMNPFKEAPPLLELCLDLETTWELDRLGGSTGFVAAGGAPTVGGNWRFQAWDAASAYWRYGYSGQIGNYTVRVDPRQLRFNFQRDLGAGSAPNRYRYQLVLPYSNTATAGAGGAPGLGSHWNTDYDRAQYAIGFIPHPMAVECLVADATPVNPQMPFSSRNFGGRWQFVMDNLGADSTGRAIENMLRNKGLFVANFKQSIRPLNTELAEAFFYKREPACVIAIDTCNGSPGYPTQRYGSCPTNPCTGQAAV